MSLPLPRSILSGLALLLLLPTVATWQLFRRVAQQRAEVQRMHHELEMTTAEKEVVQSRIDEIQADLESAESSPKPTGSGTTRAPRSQSSPSAPGDPWATPPDVLPDWNPSSPYIWLSKESLATLPIQPFHSLGKLDGEVVEILGIDPGLAKELHSTCADILRRREALETELAVASFPGPSTNRMHLEVQFPANVAAELQGAFEGTFRQSLGTQRAELILTLGRSWIDEQFSPTKSVTVTLLPGDKYEISSSFGVLFRSFGGVRSLDGYMPPHFATRFNAYFDSVKRGRAKDSETDKTPQKPR
jgi:hypothetical protein